MDNKEFIKQWAQADWDVGMTFDPDDYSTFCKICKEQGIDCDYELFGYYFDCLDEIREKQFEEDFKIEVEHDDEGTKINAEGDEADEVVDLAKFIFGDEFDSEFEEPVDEVEIPEVEIPADMIEVEQPQEVVQVSDEDIFEQEFDEQPKEEIIIKAEVPAEVELPEDGKVEVNIAPEAEQAVASVEQVATEAPCEGECCDPHCEEKQVCPVCGREDCKCGPECHCTPEENCGCKEEEKQVCPECGKEICECGNLKENIILTDYVQAEMEKGKSIDEILDSDDFRRLAKEEGKKDLELEEETHPHEAQPEVDLVKVYNTALKLAKQENKPVIYGYFGSDKHGHHRYFEIEAVVCDDVESCVKDVMKQYSPAGSVLVAYPDKSFIEEKLEECTTAEFVNEAKVSDDGIQFEINDYDENGEFVDSTKEVLQARDNLIAAKEEAKKLNNEILDLQALRDDMYINILKQIIADNNLDAKEIEDAVEKENIFGRKKLVKLDNSLWKFIQENTELSAQDISKIIDENIEYAQLAEKLGQKINNYFGALKNIEKAENELKVVAAENRTDMNKKFKDMSKEEVASEELEENKKVTYTTGDPALNAAHFNGEAGGEGCCEELEEKEELKDFDVFKDKIVDAVEKGKEQTLDDVLASEPENLKESEDDISDEEFLEEVGKVLKEKHCENCEKEDKKLEEVE